MDPKNDENEKPMRRVEALETPRKEKWFEQDRLPRRIPRKAVHARGSAESRHAQAVFYLRNFDYESAFLWDRQPEATLAKVVCNLRNFHLQSREATIKLVREFFNPRARYNWSPAGIGLTWDLVEHYTPLLGILDQRAADQERADDLYDRAVDLILMMEPGGRVLASDLYAFFLSENSDLEPAPTAVAVGIAIGDVTGKSPASSKGKKYYSGFHLPGWFGLKAAA